MTGPSELGLKVWIEDVWDTVPVPAAPDWPVGRVKEEALRTGVGGGIDPARYAVKFRGALVTDERVSLAELGVPPMAVLAVLAAARRPVR
ncbi:MAG: hypothetical protein JSW71_14415 [Gemmatimonadota bacterium]|nr:MAG: hypothetical protein JSW71_14415 [Gemmatimonadota bacterium]